MHVRPILERFAAINENQWNLVGVLLPQFGVCVDVHFTPFEVGLPLSAGERFFNDFAEMAALSRIHHHIVHFVIVSVSGWASTKHLLLALEEFRSLGIQFISYQENIDTTSPLGQALFTIVAAVAQLERDLIGERVRAGLRNARAKGKKFGRQRVQVDPARVAALRFEGLSWSQVCERLKLSKGTAQPAFYGLPNHPQE